MDKYFDNFLEFARFGPAIQKRDVPPENPIFVRAQRPRTIDKLEVLDADHTGSG